MGIRGRLHGFFNNDQGLLDVTVTEINRIRGTLKPGQRYLGLDIGSKTIGLALSDVTGMLASPAETIRRGKFAKDVQRLREMIIEHDVGALILGLPISMDGTEGPRCQSVRDFARNLLESIDIPIGFWDERLSTAAVQRILIKEADMTRKRRAQVVDKMAAAYILQGALDVIGGMAAG
jgi:putative Holliday junction resolvase